jgi:predicted solute-binding protein
MDLAVGLRYGSVPYLNARPLLEGLADEVGAVRLEVPGVLSRLLVTDRLDVALAPVVVALDHPELVLVPAGAVVARGPVKSVLLFCRVPIASVSTVALDGSSRTSAALVRVLCRHRWGVRPSFVTRAPDPDLRVLREDAALLIGDPALTAQWDGPPPIDLGLTWTEWTGLPFVFAAWFARNADLAARAAPALERAAVRGRAALAEIAHDGAGRLGLADAEAVRYLRDHLSFTLGDDERRGLERFAELWRVTPGVSGGTASEAGEDDPGPPPSGIRLFPT